MDGDHRRRHHQRSSGSVPSSYELGVSFSSAPTAPVTSTVVPIHDMGFADQFEDQPNHDHHNHHNVLSFLSPSSTGAAVGGQLSSPPPPSSLNDPLNSGGTAVGFCHGDLVVRPSWNNEQVV